MTASSMLGRIRNGFKLLFPDRSLRYFPPDFTLRRPVIGLLKKSWSRRQSCYLALFRVEFSDWQQEVPQEIWSRCQAAARRQLRASVPTQGHGGSLIVMDEFERGDYVVLMEHPPSAHAEAASLLPMSLKQRLEHVREGLETVLHAEVGEWRSNMQIVTHYTLIAAPASPGDDAIDAALQDAYRLALAITSKQIMPQAEVVRRQLTQLLERGAVSVLAQPIMDLTSGDIFGWEMLARGPSGSIFHMPDELFRLATQTKLLSRLEFLVIGKALEEVAVRGIKERVLLNVTAVTLAHPMFLPHVLDCLERHPSLSPDRIYFEITERHQVSDLNAMGGVLASFREYGFRFAVDDAGAGYSTLQWIGEFVPELIKIDRSVIRHVDSTAIKLSMLKALVSIAEEMKCDIVAEGVEREEEADVLFRLNVGMGQGYYFAKPNVLLDEHERGMFQETKERIQHRRGQAAS